MKIFVKMSFGFSSWDILRGSFLFSAFLWFLFDPKLAFLFLSVQAIILTVNTRQTSDARKTMANIKNLEPSFVRHFGTSVHVSIFCLNPKTTFSPSIFSSSKPMAFLFFFRFRSSCPPHQPVRRFLFHLTFGRTGPWKWNFMVEKIEWRDFSPFNLVFIKARELENTWGLYSGLWYKGFCATLSAARLRKKLSKRVPFKIARTHIFETQRNPLYLA